MTSRIDPEWTYDALARNYDHRPDYDARLIAQILDKLDLDPRNFVVDVGAGTGKFTAHLCKRRSNVIAIEPSAAMRERALGNPVAAKAHWIAAVAESLPLRDESVALVTYASSLNCVQSDAALREASRVLAPGGHLIALWNYRDVDDRLQASIERMLVSQIPGYDPGARRTAPMEHAALSTLFGALGATEQRFVVEVDAPQWIDAWHAHRTVIQQAGDRMHDIVDRIRALVGDRMRIQVPYITRAWTAAVVK